MKPQSETQQLKPTSCCITLKFRFCFNIEMMSC
jgi:hypothetical protein